MQDSNLPRHADEGRKLASLVQFMMRGYRFWPIPHRFPEVQLLARMPKTTPLCLLSPSIWTSEVGKLTKRDCSKKLHYTCWQHMLAIHISTFIIIIIIIIIILTFFFSTRIQSSVRALRSMQINSHATEGKSVQPVCWPKSRPNWRSRLKWATNVWVHCMNGVKGSDSMSVLSTSWCAHSAKLDAIHLHKALGYAFNCAVAYSLSVLCRPNSSAVGIGCVFPRSKQFWKFSWPVWSSVVGFGDIAPYRPCHTSWVFTRGWAHRAWTAGILQIEALHWLQGGWSSSLSLGCSRVAHLPFTIITTIRHRLKAKSSLLTKRCSASCGLTCSNPYCDFASRTTRGPPSPVVDPAIPPHSRATENVWHGGPMSAPSKTPASAASRVAFSHFAGRLSGSQRWCR